MIRIAVIARIGVKFVQWYKCKIFDNVRVSNKALSYQQFIMMLYIALVQPGGGGSLYPV